MAAPPSIGTRITMSCHEGIWEILEGSQQCRFRGRVCLATSSIEYPMHPVHVIEEQLEWILPIPTPFLVADSEQVVKILASSKDSKKDDRKRKAVDSVVDDQGKRPKGGSPKESSFRSGAYVLRCYCCGGEHLRKSCPQRQWPQSRSVADGCYVCGKQGHVARECWHAVKPQRHSDKKTE